jgi:cobyrinic acid a,c-diamide synthase
MTSAGAEARGASGFVVSGDRGSAGKTTFSIGLARHLRQTGRAVQTFKKGPDFIDPMWHTRASGRSCRHLDFMMMGEGTIRERFARWSADADVALVEGNKGLFDGVDTDGSNSTSALARLLAVPVVLVVDCARVTRGIAALLLGYTQFERDLRFAGVVLNNVSTSRHEAKLRAAVERYTDMTVLGALARSSSVEIRERHLGLVPDGETGAADVVIDACARAVAQGVDVGRLLERTAGVVALPASAEARGERSGPSTVTIAVARDRAFSFYYPESLEALRAAGARLAFFSPLVDRLPACDAAYLGGGFPEVYASELARNGALFDDLRDLARRGAIYAECGGLLALGRSLIVGGVEHRMAGVLPLRAEMTDRPQGRGYMKLRPTGANATWSIPSGASFWAHEFHHSRVRVEDDRARYAYAVERGAGIGGGVDGILHEGVLASYAHVHPASAPWWAGAFVQAARRAAQAQDASCGLRVAV